MIKFVKICDACGQIISIFNKKENFDSNEEHICNDCKSRNYDMSYGDENETYKNLPSEYWEKPLSLAKSIRDSQGGRPPHERERTGESKPFEWLESSPLDEIEDN